jgi:hypothetical protein
MGVLSIRFDLDHVIMIYRIFTRLNFSHGEKQKKYTIRTGYIQ